MRFGRANPHALATISRSQRDDSGSIATTDIFRHLGHQALWAGKQPVSTALQRKLLDRQLRRPLESCLVAEDGITSATIVQALQQLLQAATRRSRRCCERTGRG